MHDDYPMDEHATVDDLTGIAWWNALPDRERGQWMARAGNTGRAKDAWEAFKRNNRGDELVGLADAMAGTTNAASWIRDMARHHGVTFAQAPVDTFATAVSCLSDAGVQLDEIEQLLLALTRAGVVSDAQRFALHATYLRQSRA